MGMMPKKDVTTALLVLVLATVGAVLFVAGCSEKSGGTRFSNLSPDTFISYGPPADSVTYFKVQAFWYGADQDGDIDSFEVVAIKDPYSYNLDSLIQVDPGLSMLGWRGTTSRESTFVLEADSCCHGSGGGPAASAYWGIMVRAVDNDGAVDLTPASVFFEAENVLPKARLDVPLKTTSGYITTAEHPYFEWSGEDPDGEARNIEYKYVVAVEGNPPTIRWNIFDQSKIPPMDFTDSTTVGSKSPAVGRWSEWVPQDCTMVRDLDLSVYRGEPVFLLFCVTARDEGGAVLPKNLWGTYNGSANWQRMAILLTPTGVPTIIDAGVLGVRNSSDVKSQVEEVAGVFAGTELGFRFYSAENRARGELTASYRYYYDYEDGKDPAPASWPYYTSVEPIREPGGTPHEWFVRYPELDDGTYRFTPTVGRHVFVVETRDYNKVDTHVEFNFEVLPGPPPDLPTHILLVDDAEGGFLEPGWSGFNARQDSMWADILDGYDFEVHNTGKKFENEVSVRQVALATTTIWHTGVDRTERGHITQVLTEKGNYLHSYVLVGGNLIIIGYEPFFGTMFWPDGTPDPQVSGQREWFDFRPTAVKDSVLHFMYDVFGVEQMKQPGVSGVPDNYPDPLPLNAIYPCEDGWPIVDAYPEGWANWPGRKDNAMYITQLREDMDVLPIYTSAIREGEESTEIRNCETHVSVVYVPGDGTRGHAAYIQIPPVYFKQEQVKELILKLLEEFGETPK
jgi:hypothetical protein